MRAAGLTLLLATAPAWAGGEGLAFAHKDWELACDNTGTCRAAGYQADGDRPAVSVLLTRAAGPGTAVKGQLQLGTFDADPLPARVPVSVNGRALGNVALNDGTGDLSEPQVAAMLAALAGKARIVFGSGDSRWAISDQGAAAVLLKMDEAQGRLGTQGALMRKGPAAEDKVPPAVPAPVVRVAVPLTAGSGDAALGARIAPQLKAADCDKGAAGEVEVWRLDATRVLVSRGCWRAAYNSGSGFWVANDKPPYQPKLVTTRGTDYDGEGTISASHKGRGLGDCVASDEWVWDGREFVHTAAMAGGMCRMVAAGGAWELPLRVTDVRRTGQNQSKESRK